MTNTDNFDLTPDELDGIRRRRAVRQADNDELQDAIAALQVRFADQLGGGSAPRDVRLRLIASFMTQIDQLEALKFASPAAFVAAAHRGLNFSGPADSAAAEPRELEGNKEYGSTMPDPPADMMAVYTEAELLAPLFHYDSGRDFMDSWGPMLQRLADADPDNPAALETLIGRIASGDPDVALRRGGSLSSEENAAQLEHENGQLKQQNEQLRSELAGAKRQCEGLPTGWTVQQIVSEFNARGRENDNLKREREGLPTGWSIQELLNDWNAKRADLNDLPPHYTVRGLVDAEATARRQAAQSEAIIDSVRRSVEGRLFGNDPIIRRASLSEEARIALFSDDTEL